MRSLAEHIKKKNSFLIPYESPKDERLTWLKDVFVKYLESWEQSTLTREADYTADERQKMFMSSQTYEDVTIAVNSHVDAINFLLSEGFKYVLTEIFMQDSSKITLDTKERKGEDQIIQLLSSLDIMISQLLPNETLLQ